MDPVETLQFDIEQLKKEIAKKRKLLRAYQLIIKDENNGTTQANSNEEKQKDVHPKRTEDKR